MKKKSIQQYLAMTTVAAALSVAPALGWAVESESFSEPSPFIEQFDADGDGLVSVSEFPGDEMMFSGLDVDDSGYIDADEAPQGPPPHGGPDSETMLSEFDIDGDGLLSADEFPGPQDHFNHLDADADGLLSADELATAGPGPRPEGEDGFANDDVDQDGYVSQAEFSGPEEHFAQLDTDGDGYISEQEVRSAAPPQGGPGFFAGVRD